MKKYTTPNVEITAFDVEDIITASGANGAILNAADLSGTDADMYNVYKESSANPTENVSIFTW